MEPEEESEIVPVSACKSCGCYEAYEMEDENERTVLVCVECGDAQ